MKGLFLTIFSFFLFMGMGIAQDAAPLSAKEEVVTKDVATTKKDLSIDSKLSLDKFISDVEKKLQHSTSAEDIKKYNDALIALKAKRNKYYSLK